MSSFFCNKNSQISQLLKRIFFCFFYFAICVLTVINPISLKVSPAQSCNVAYGANFPSLQQIIKSIFHKETYVEPHDKVYVYLGGYPLGFTLKCDGVLIVAISNPNNENLVEGDIITKIEDYEVNGVEQIADIINNKVDSTKYLNLEILRNNEVFYSKILPVYDDALQKYKLGVWIRDDAAGVGTLTYVRKDNMRFGALGHAVCDIDTGSLMPVSSGNIYKCNIVGFKKGEKGNPGELKGLFLRNGSRFGALDKNTKFGVYGNFDENKLPIFNDNIVEVADKSEVKSGKATIRCTIDGSEPQDYEIEIVKTYFQATNETKSMFIRVTDNRLIEQTGGIIQGMSGSPIIQNGKLVGAVTHVFVSDPTKGYGVYADWMINN